MKCRFILDKKFRQGSLYKLTEWDQLGSYQKELLVGLENEADVYGLFEPVSDTSNLTFKVAYREVAMLYLHFQYNNKLPHYFIVSVNKNITEILIRLILDEIIQIEGETGYVSGAAALPVLYGENIFEEHTVPGYLSALSFKAIYYAWMLHDADLTSITQKLYSFNTVPWDAFMKSRFYETHSIKEFLFSRVNETSRHMLDEQWQTYPNDENKYWLSWSRHLPGQLLQERSHTCKLYISPHINDLPEIFRRFIPVISASQAFSFKAGNSLQGLLRPDKMVAYFYSKEALFYTAGLLREELGNYPSQGVPFTTQLDETGLLSYGEDPPVTEVLSSVDGGSWRTFITDQLALAIVQARKNKLSWQQTMGFIRAMLLTEGVDSYNWTTTNGLTK